MESNQWSDERRIDRTDDQTHLFIANALSLSHFLCSSCLIFVCPSSTGMTDKSLTAVRSLDEKSLLFDHTRAHFLRPGNVGYCETNDHLKYRWRAITKMICTGQIILFVSIADNEKESHPICLECERGTWLSHVHDVHNSFFSAFDGQSNQEVHFLLESNRLSWTSRDRTRTTPLTGEVNLLTPFSCFSDQDDEGDLSRSQLLHVFSRWGRRISTRQCREANVSLLVTE